MKLEKIRVGRIVGVHGIRGELRAVPLEEDAAFLARCSPLLLNGEAVEPVSARVHKGAVLLKLPGVEDRTQAEGLRDQELWVRREDAPLPEGDYFDQELLGLDVYDWETGACIGELTAVEQYPASKVYTVRGVKEFLVPAVKGAFVQSIDLEANRMELKMWEGLTE